jgi:hypothetical protein
MGKKTVETAAKSISAVPFFRTHFGRYYEPESDLGGTETIHPENP